MAVVNFRTDLVDSSGTYDDLIVSLPPGPGDANDDDSSTTTMPRFWAAIGRFSRARRGPWAISTSIQKVDDKDAAILAANWTGPAGSASVPEPGTLVLLVSAALALWFWRRR